MWHLLPLADPGPELPLQLLSPKRSAKVFHLALCAGLDQVVEIFTAVSPSPSDETQQVSKALEPCHKCARLARCCAPHLLVSNGQQYVPGSSLARRSACFSVWKLKNSDLVSPSGVLDETQTYRHCYRWEKHVSILLDYLYISSDEISVSRIIAGKIWFNISRHQSHII